jgi:succinoglycan biosynthesis protein ExoM
MEKEIKTVAICIATFKRPELLHNCLASIGQLIIPDDYTPIIIVVDNDNERSGESGFNEAIKNTNINSYYYVEPEQGLSAVRNNLLEKALDHNVDFIAFIDDDELAHKQWLINMVKGFEINNCDIVTAPVLPINESVAPDTFTTNPKRASGSTPRTISTNNVIFRRKLIDEHGLRFDRYFDFIGGEDFDFFDRAIKKGMTAVWINNAIVFETIFPERKTRKHMMYRHFTGGINAIMRHRRHHSLISAWSRYLPKIIGKIISSLISLLISPFYEHKKNFNKFLIKASNGIGYLCGLLNIIVERYRY